MRIAITGRDPRFPILRELFLADGHEIVSPDRAEILVPPPWDPEAAYARSECYKIANAALTAQGAAALLAAERPLPGAAALVLGFGRVGRLCARTLKEAGCSVRAAARRAESRALAEAEGFQSADTAAMEDALGAADLVVNTVPEPLLTEALLPRVRKDAVLLVAVYPGHPEGIRL